MLRVNCRGDRFDLLEPHLMTGVICLNHQNLTLLYDAGAILLSGRHLDRMAYDLPHRKVLTISCFDSGKHDDPLGPDEIAIDSIDRREPKQ